ncbi:dipeptide ABC transporter ATP-binding protein [Saccharomonospora azurea]|uniref:ATPase component of various ABC-type transport systems with duplicated ATPase domain n=1 Tax=Saccharomonospora azurea NA-128 TaxID=882081 RepID=H8GAQ7_9PSEU|nr:ABC transporter ATP-binding protein [Saccharomonospora azurea]EHK87546.1 ATPase component of various ABC-type transport systems with duplicated ATPase domain-containing protein [Saccharomonospora azurea SZMC 14600]EHY87623.1 ATPase component of various ABC-type transport systems with duplicated ATPase domain [Saccharomonospora azurea NA-128]
MAPETPETPLLRLSDLGVTYRTAGGEVPAVRDVDLTLRAGETLGIAGESGSGKSTVAMSLLRLLPKSATVTGEVLLDGEDVNTMRWGRLRAVRWSAASIVFQGAMHALNPVRTVGEQIAEPIRLHTTTNGATKDRVAELLRQVDLPPERANAYPHELSGGQKQRVMIAMALACEPKLIVADEPTTALDVVVQDQVLRLLSDLVAQRGIGLVMISHDLGVLAQTCERVAVMYRGEVVEEGPSGEVFDNPRHDHTRALAAAIHRIGDPESRMVTDRDTAVIGGDTEGTEGAPDEEILAARDLVVTFRDRSRQVVRAVDGVDLGVRRGEIVALVGQSGSGKTTLARTMLGLQKPTSGSVLFDGSLLPTSMSGLRAYRRRVQLVLQDPTSALNPRHTVYEAVAEGPRIHKLAGEERDIVVAALEAAELRPAERYLSRLPHELSGGQRQRVVIAGALACEPSVLIADEPVASLDATVRNEILALLLRLRRDLGLAALVITHDLGLAWAIADRVAVMHQGRIVEQGPVETVLLNPRHEYTRSLLAALPTPSTSAFRRGV